ncbi:MAG TPA: enolase C-terminal domain-like protein [Bryobacteraceae bacterium]|nr:enolase C-terminal domain-like protein [Bryobacteraceae bacterium]
MIRIRGLQARAVRVPMENPHRTASGTVAESPLVLIDALTDGGVTGHGIVFTYTAAALKPTAALIQNLASLIEGETLAPAAIEQKLASRFRLLGTQGLVGMALSGIDMAVWDALARANNVSLLTLLGVEARPIRAYGAVGYDGEVESARVAECWARRGFTGVKAKIGYSAHAEDLAVIRAIRNAVGPEVAVMVDYNQSLTPTEAVERLRRLDDQDLTWIEEPTLAHDYRGHAHIAREIRTPIQCGENWWGVRDMQHAIDARASDYMMPDVMKIGGVTGWMRAAALGEAHGIRLSSHLWPEISAQLLCATPTAHWLEYSDWWNAVVAEPLRLEKGLARLEGVTGTGVQWNEEAVRRYEA